VITTEISCCASTGVISQTGRERFTSNGNVNTEFITISSGSLVVKEDSINGGQ
jgi:hypothetical protein